MAQLPQLREIDRAGIDVEPLALALGDGPSDDSDAFIKRQFEIAKALGPAGLGHLEPFNTIYTGLSYKVQIGVNNGYFQYPHYVTGNMPVFGWHYQKNVGHFVDYARGDDEALGRMNPAWLITMMDSRVEDAPQWQQLLLGIIAHIRSEDLPRSMAETNPGREYKDDYWRVQQLIREVIASQLHEYLPDRQHEPLGLAFGISSMIAAMRGTAYRNSWKLRAMAKQGQDTQPRLDLLNNQATRYNKIVLSTGNAAVALTRLLPRVERGQAALGRSV